MKARRKLAAGLLAVGMPSHRDEAVLNAGGRRMESCVYDKSKDGGALGTYKFARLLPAGAVVTAVFSDELTTVTGATDITLQAGSTALTGSIDFTGDAGFQSRALAGSVAGIKLAADSELNIVIGTAVATAGKIRFYVQYMLAND